MPVNAIQWIGQKDQPAQPARLQEAAQNFEALLIAQLLNSFQAESQDGCFGSGGDSAGATMLEFAGQQMADLITRQGGFGLSQLIVEGLRQTTESTAKAEGA